MRLGNAAWMVTALTGVAVAGCSRQTAVPVREVRMTEIGGEETVPLALPITLQAPPGRAIRFLFTDKPIEELAGVRMISLMNGTGIAWDLDKGSVTCYRYGRLEKGKDYIRASRDELGFDAATQDAIVALADRNGVKSPETIYTFGTYRLAPDTQEQRIVEVQRRAHVRYLYTFETIAESEYVDVVRKRRQAVKVIPPGEGT